MGDKTLKTDKMEYQVRDFTCHFCNPSKVYKFEVNIKGRGEGHKHVRSHVTCPRCRMQLSQVD